MSKPVKAPTRPDGSMTSNTKTLMIATYTSHSRMSRCHGTGLLLSQDMRSFYQYRPLGFDRCE